MACLLAGCNATPQEVLAPVAGKVTVDAEPLPLGYITFYPDESKDNKSTKLPYGQIQADGSYTLVTNSKPGAPPGWYKVVVAATKDPLPARPPPNWSPNWLHDAKYARPDTTDLKVEVVASPVPGRYDFALTR